MKVEVVHNVSPLYSALQDFASRHSLLFHSEAWLKTYDPQRLVQCAILNRNEEIIGCFLYYRFRKLGFHCVISPPFTPDICLFCIDPSESVVGGHSFRKELMETLALYFDALKVAYVHIHFPGHIIDTQPFIWKGYLSRNRYSYLIDLSATEEQLRANLSSEKRKSLNKAAKDGLEIVPVNDAETVYQLVCQSLDRSSQHANRQIVKNIIYAFTGTPQVIVHAAQLHGQFLSVAFCLVSQNKALYLFGGLDAGNKHHGAGVACMWNCILSARQKGLALFDFEGSMRPAIERYFREFGGALTPYYNVEKTSVVMKTLLTLKGHSTT